MPTRVSLPPTLTGIGLADFQFGFPAITLTDSGMSDMTNLPDIISLQIFRHLPLTDLVRCVRVCWRFCDLSTHVLAETKSLDLSDPIFRRICPYQLSILIGVCAERLQMVNFPRVIHPHMVEMMAQFHFPRLTDLNLGNSDIGNKTFGQMIKNCPNLARLTWGNFYTWMIYPEVVSDKLSCLRVSRADDACFRSLTGRCPELKHLEVNSVARVDGETLDTFFAHCPNLEILTIGNIHIRGDVRFQSMDHFWSLSSLRVLRIGNDYHREMVDADLEKISASFPHLQHLELSQLTVSNWGVSNLASLNNLSTLTLSLKDVHSNDISEGIRRIAECGRLVEARFDANIKTIAFMALIRFCHRLNFMFVRNIHEVETVAMGAQMLESLGGISKRDMTIRVLKGFDMWNSVEMKPVLNQLKTSSGLGIEFEHGYIDCLLCGRAILDEMEGDC